jgi:hypothetical protein
LQSVPFVRLQSVQSGKLHIEIVIGSNMPTVNRVILKGTDCKSAPASTNDFR